MGTEVKTDTDIINTSCTEIIKYESININDFLEIVRMLVNYIMDHIRRRKYPSYVSIIINIRINEKWYLTLRSFNFQFALDIIITYEF
ncbi:hypothetical protein COB64_02940 [Candidatus Wolfebacteria bacterium]|nr:MAG: hypothetical protein COB64_02940 [Candidatus Wolfebacteria bacterium]